MASNNDEEIKKQKLSHFLFVLEKKKTQWGYRDGAVGVKYGHFVMAATRKHNAGDEVFFVF